MLKDNIPQFICNEPQINDLLTAIQPEIDSLRQELEIDEKQLYAITTDSQVKPKDVFNREAFTVVGSPTITDDGIVSGFNKESYLKASSNIDLTNANRLKIEGSFIIKGRPVPDNGGRSQCVLHLAKLGIGNDDSIKLLVSFVDSKSCAFTYPTSATSIGLTSWQPIEWGKVNKFSIALEQSRLTFTLNSVSTVVDNVQASWWKHDRELWFGNSANDAQQEYINGSIDLKQFSISVDGGEVFNKDAFEVVGTPNITDDGIASGFSKISYLNTGYVLGGNNNSWEIKTKVRFSNFTEMQNIFCSSFKNNASSDNNPILLNILQNGKLRLSLSETNNYGSGTPTIGQFFGSKVFELNKDYFISLSYTGNKYLLSYSENGKDYINDITVNNSNKVAEGTVYIGLRLFVAITGNPFAGSIDLKQFSISVDGEEVFKGTKYVEPQEFKGTKEVWQSEYMQRWERDYGLPMDLSLTIEERRNRLLSKIRRKRILNKAGLKALIKATVNDAQFHIVNKPHQYKFTVYLSDIAQKEKLHTTLYYARPAHLIYDIIELIDVRRCGTFNCGSNPL